jgi:hypothetical protein
VSQPEGRKDGYTEEGYKKVTLNATLPNPQQKGRAVKKSLSVSNVDGWKTRGRVTEESSIYILVTVCRPTLKSSKTMGARNIFLMDKATEA